MRSLLLSLTVLVLASTSFAQTRVDPSLFIPFNDQFLDDAAVRGYFADLLKKGRFGRLPREEAAFLIKRSNGDYRCSMWPSSHDYHQTKFVGAIPNGTVAIVHTHPIQYPQGSPHDQRTAKRLGVPIFVLTPRNIYVVTVEGENQPIVSHERWEPVRTSKSFQCINDSTSGGMK